MARRKGQGNKGKQPAKKRPVPQVSPLQSSSDKESWSVWQQLQEKIPALEAERLVQQAPQVIKAQPCHLARDAQSHHRAKLKVIADDLMSRFVGLEAEQHSEGRCRYDAEGATATP